LQEKGQFMPTAIIRTSEKQVIDSASDGLDTIKTLAPKLRRSPRTIQSWMKAGKLPYIKIGKSVLFRWRDVLERLNQFRVN
jgi:excisionase family DNA binding protein